MMGLALPVLLLRLLWRSHQHSGYRSQIWHRFGFYGRHRALRSGERVWIHAVSVGETLAIVPLLERLLAQRQDLSAMVTFYHAHRCRAGAAEIGWPCGAVLGAFRYPGAVRRFLGHCHPALGALVETEIWPNLLTHSLT